MTISASITMKSAWLLTWEGSPNRTVVPDKKIITILSARRSASYVADLVDTLYCRSINSAFDMAFMANRRRERERQYRHLSSTSQRLFYGNDPCIFARIVSDLSIERDRTQYTEHIKWKELAVMGNAKSNSSITEIYADRTCSMVRPLRPLSVALDERKI